MCIMSLRQRNWFSQTGHLDIYVYLTTVQATAVIKMQQRDVETGGPTVCTIPLMIAVVESVEVGSYCVNQNIMEHMINLLALTVLTENFVNI